jgi:hypothetical protein
MTIRARVAFTARLVALFGIGPQTARRQRALYGQSGPQTPGPLETESEAEEI